MEKLVRNGMVAVLYSPGYGAGWSTWNYQYPEILYDPEIASVLEDYVEMYDEESVKVCQEKILAIAEKKYPDGYFGGVDDLTIMWMPVGTKFLVNEYDGSESIQICEEMRWEVA
jgi:hypothetical protein